MASDTTPAPMLTGKAGLAAMLAISASGVDRLRACGELGPQPVRIGGQLRWNVTEVQAWLDSPLPSGELHTAKTWPAIWATIRSQAKK